MAFFAQYGSAKRGRPMLIKSAFPLARISSAKSGCVMEPVANTGMLTSFLMASAAHMTPGNLHGRYLMNHLVVVAAAYINGRTA